MWCLSNDVCLSEQKGNSHRRRATEAPGHLSEGHALMSVLTLGKWKSGLRSINSQHYWTLSLSRGGVHCRLLATCPGFLRQPTALLLVWITNSTTGACMCESIFVPSLMACLPFTMHAHTTSSHIIILPCHHIMLKVRYQITRYPLTPSFSTRGC